MTTYNADRQYAGVINTNGPGQAGIAYNYPALGGFPGGPPATTGYFTRPAPGRDWAGNVHPQTTYMPAATTGPAGRVMPRTHQPTYAVVEPAVPKQTRLVDSSTKRSESSESGPADNVMDPEDDLAWIRDIDMTSFTETFGVALINDPAWLASEERLRYLGNVFEKEPSQDQYKGYAPQTMAPPARPVAARKAPVFKTPAPVVKTGSSTKKPNWSYTNLAALAIKNSPTGELVVKDIYKFIIDRFPYFRTAPMGWKNAIRHTLSLSQKFHKNEVQTHDHGRKRCLWSIREDKLEKIDQDLQHNASRQDYEDMDDYETRAAAAAIDSSSVSESRKYDQHTRELYDQNARELAQKPSFTFKPANQMVRPSAPAVPARPIDPSEISLHDTKPPAPAQVQKAPMARPAKAVSYGSAPAPAPMARPASSYGQMRSPLKRASNSFNGRALSGPGQMGHFDTRQATPQQVQRVNPSILNRKRTPNAPAPMARPSAYGHMRSPLKTASTSFSGSASSGQSSHFGPGPSKRSRVEDGLGDISRFEADLDDVTLDSLFSAHERMRAPRPSTYSTVSSTPSPAMSAADVEKMDEFFE